MVGLFPKHSILTDQADTQKGHPMAKLGSTLQPLQASWNWKQHGTSIVGKRADWWFVIGQSGALQPIVVSAALANLQPASLEQLKAAILAKRKLYKLSQFDNKNHVLTFSLKADFSSAKNAERVELLVEDLIVSFRQLGLVSGCQLCAGEQALHAVRIGENTAAVCDACHAHLEEQFSGIVEKNEVQGNYLTGLIGALLGALAGSALWLLVSYLGFYASIVGFVIAFLAQYGYRLFKGRVSRAMPLIVAVSVVLGVLAANVAEVAISLVQDPEIGMSWADAIHYAPMALYDTELFYVGQVWGGIAIGMLFAFLGGWRTIRGLIAETRGVTYQIETL
jgi:hypothetical protein